MKDMTINTSVEETTNEEIIVRYCSNVYFNFNWETKKQAFVSESVFKCGSKASYGVNTGVIEAVDDSGFGFRVTDSRGNEVTHSGAFLRLNYRKPTCNLSVALPTTEGKTIIFLERNSEIALQQLSWLRALHIIKNTIMYQKAVQRVSLTFL